MMVNCKACGKEIAKGVKKCPHCGKDQRNFFGKHKIITAILVLVIIGGIGSALGGKGNKSTSASAPTTTSTSSSSTTKPTEQPKPTELSNTGTSSNVKITVTGFQTAATVGTNEYSTAKAQGVFKIVKLTITNNQKDAITVDSNSFKLVDDQGREFTDSTEAQTALMTSDSSNQNFFLKQINPGITVSGLVVFDVPKDAKGFKLKATGGMMGDPIMLKVE
ncbi:DUF4352 domain-containing protein [Desulfosporosinus sp. FKA]|uniref:DUF4352 domain-containing protein n=1 Tax=Desulfosporosinus sp. FKA TaxID=1969834 RepID=UPI001A9A4646|nr:DUF4352 domain-containing protein [Desulfosporosinus sp. FKA]